MLRSTATCLRNCPNRKLKLQILDQLQKTTFIRSLTPRGRAFSSNNNSTRRYPVRLLVSKPSKSKLGQYQNFAQFCRNNAILAPVGVHWGSCRLHNSQAARAQEPQPAVFNNNKNEKEETPGRENRNPKTTQVSDILEVSHQQHPIPLNIVSVLDEPFVEPLKLLNATDPKILKKLYKPPLSYPNLYMKLAKARLTSFVVITSAAGYSIGAASFLTPELLWISLGTFMTSASAHTFNQIMEVKFDGMMDRTKNRVLVRNLISREHAIAFGVVSGLVGVGALYSVNELCALIGAGNLIAYTCMYTPMKRMHYLNTWVGSVVGALPPLIGYAGAVGYLDSKAAILSAIMFCWQFPHFNALSWNLRSDYSRAGYKMMCFENPRLCRHTTLRYSLLLSAVCAASPLTGASEAIFVADSGLSWKFYQNPDAKTSRNLFLYTLIHLPILMILFLISNKMVRSRENKALLATEPLNSNPVSITTA